MKHRSRRAARAWQLLSGRPRDRGRPSGRAAQRLADELPAAGGRAAERL